MADRGSQDVHLDVEAGRIDGTLSVPARARGLVVFVHGSGSGRHSPRNQQVARAFQDARFATLLFDLLTREEDEIDQVTRHLRFDIGLLARRVLEVIEVVRRRADVGRLPLGLFGASTGAAAALVAAALRPEAVRAVVSRGGRPDLAGEELPSVRAPTLLLVGELDDVVIPLNEQALSALRTEARLEIVPYATHLFEEPGALERVAALAVRWFEEHLDPASSQEQAPSLP